MKKIALIFTTGLMTLMLNTGCNKVLDINTDPNNPTNANPEQLLPSAQITLASNLGNQYTFVASMWSQYWTSGTTISLTPLEIFTMVGGDINRSWGNSYARTLQDLNQLTKSGQPIYSGIAKVLMVYNYQVLVDLHGDIPYSEALKGAVADGGITTPKFDEDATIYAALETLIDEAIVELNATGGTVRTPGADDLVFEGDVDSWKALANTVKLRLLVRQCQTNPAKLDAAYALIGSGAAFTGASVYFSGANLGNSNPLWARFESRPQTAMYLRASKTSVDYLTNNNDPRLSGIYKKGTDPGFTGIEQGEANTPAYQGTSNNKYAEPNPTYVYNKSLPYWIIAPWDVDFMIAEVHARKGNESEAKAAWETGVSKSFAYYGLGSPATYLNELVSHPWGASTEQQLAAIATQKWIASNGLNMVEGWIETRRFDTPTQTIFRSTDGIFHQPSNSSLADGVFPSTFMYGSGEISFNPNTPAHSVTDKVFWDN